MQNFVVHMIKERINDIVDNSYLNVGVKGLHCLDIISGNDFGIKLYITDTNHDLAHNYPNNYHTGITLPFACYNRNIRIEQYKGSSNIWKIKKNDKVCNLLLDEYFTHNDNGVIEYQLVSDNNSFQTDSVAQLSVNQCLNVRGDELFTVACTFGTCNAWFVYEGKPVSIPNYNIYTNSKKNLSGFLYQRPDKNQVLQLLNKVGIIRL